MNVPRALGVFFLGGDDVALSVCHTHTQDTLADNCIGEDMLNGEWEERKAHNVCMDIDKSANGK